MWMPDDGRIAVNVKPKLTVALAPELIARRRAARREAARILKSNCDAPAVASAAQV
jgi:hypothetical protein